MAKKKKAKEADMASVAGPMDDDWKIKDALDTLIRAQEICQDEEMMKKVKKIAKKKVLAINSVDDLVKYRNEKYGSNSDKDEEDDE